MSAPAIRDEIDVMIAAISQKRGEQNLKDRSAEFEDEHARNIAAHYHAIGLHSRVKTIKHHTKFRAHNDNGRSA